MSAAKLLSENEKGNYLLSYNIRGLLEKIMDKDTGEVVERYEYHNSQFPVRIINYKDQKMNASFTHPGVRNSLTQN
jgi:hypothetical protein